MSTFIFSANVVALIQVKISGAQYRIEFTKPPKNGQCWIIGSAPTADVSIGHQTQGISDKHLGLDFGQDGMVIIKIFSSHGTSLAYHSVSDDEKVDSMVHECMGEDSPRAPAWAVPVGQRIHIFLGDPRNPLELTIQAFDHNQHLSDYMEAIKHLKASAPEAAEPTQPQPSKELSPCPSPPPPTPASGVATFMSRALGGMEIATPAMPGGTEMPSLTRFAYDIGKYTYSFLEVTPRSNQMRPGSGRVVKVLSTKTWNVYAAKYFNKRKIHLLYKEFEVFTGAKLRKAPHTIAYFERFLVPRGINKQHMLVMEWCDLGSMVEEGERKSFTYHESCMIVDQVAKALMYLHGQRFVHRDVRPQHILVRSRTTSRLEVCLTDFSSSTKIPIVTDGTNGSRWAEDEAYIAPDAFASSDQLREEHVKNLAAVDIWSLGVIALELLTGSLPTIVYETPQDMQHPILVSGQQFTKALINHRDEMAKTPAAAANGGLVPLIMEMLCPSPYYRMTAQEVAGGTIILVTLMKDDSRMEYYRKKYPGGQFPAVAAPRVHAYNLWRGVA
ncbi:kinase-like domain-containing protein [Neurospora tetraspora]|uniref:Kinase-like domain-containing protein n=1 Tax=Neurospora tetraspora TaxID=94610 RepID=A0AAE0JGC6_9PEZI|nr:kinase-like domain-containing protein [Neurospora tetraspora]